MNGIRLAVCLAVLALASASFAGWSSDPAVNLSVADGTGDQVQAKVAPTSDGGCYISWFGGPGGGYDVHVQKLDSDGNEVFPHNGVLVADRGFSSTQDYGLDVDASGNAILAFRDDRFTGEQVTASKVAPDGTLLWGTTGIQVTNTTGYVAAPCVAGTADGGVVVAWTEDADVHVQKLASDGTQVWASDVVLTPAVGTYTASDLHGTGTDVILSIVHVAGPYYAPKYLEAQKFDASGAALWGSTPISVFDTGSLQFGNFPDFVTDGSGGAVFSWYDASSSTALQCYAQHILSDGSEAFPHNGSAGSINAARQRVSPSAAYNGTTGETFMFWEEEDLSQSQSGVYGQKFDAAGARQWGSSGSMVVPVGTDSNTWVKCLTEGTGAFVFWFQAPGMGSDVLHGARLNGAGVIDISVFDVSSTPSDKGRLAGATSTAGFKVLAWQDGRNDGGDILAQNVNSDGTLGPQTGVDGATEEHYVSLGTPWPNPMSGEAQFAFSMPVSHACALAVYDVSGRVVRHLDVDPGDGGGIVSWDGLDDRGVPVSAGVYFVRLADGKDAGTAKVTVVR
jgi:hypothetical protein